MTRLLPFLKPKQLAGTIIERRKADGGKDMQGPESSSNSELSAASAALIRAVHSKDEAGVEAALRTAFEILDSEPHEEGPHTNESDSGDMS